MPVPNDKLLEALKTILFRDEKLKLQQLEQVLQDLKSQLADKESWLASLDPIIADLLERKIATSRDEMAAALSPIMSEAIKHQVAEAKDDVVDALYPIIGKLIRKAVAESMKKFVESVNHKIELSIRQGFFKKRLQSKIVGVSEGDLLLKESLPFQIQEVFLIHKTSGLLIAHVSAHNAENTVNEELISGMLTAIRDFVSEAFQTPQEHDLETIQYGETKIVLEMGQYTYLAVVFTGIEPDDFQERLQKLARQIHNRFHKILRQFDGDNSQTGKIIQPLTHFVTQFHAPPAAATVKKTRPYLLYFLIFLASVGLVIFAILKAPGYLADWKLKNAIQAQIAQMPALQNPNLSYRIAAGWLTISGQATSARQRLEIDSLAHTIQGVRGVTNRLALRDPREVNQLVTRLKQELAATDHLHDLAPTFLFDGDQVTIEGEAPTLAIKREIGFLVSEVTGMNYIFNNLKVTGEQRLAPENEAQFLQNHRIFFALDDPQIPAPELPKVNAVMAYFKKFDQVKLVVKGYSDNLVYPNAPDYNLRLSARRAQSIAAYLIQQGLAAEKIVVRYFGEVDPIAPNTTETGRAQNRRVEFEMIPER